VLLTNSHPVTLEIKNGRTRVVDHLDAAYSSHRFGAPKENPHFWAEARRVDGFDPQRALFVDDSASVLLAAEQAGIRRTYRVLHADSSGAPHHDDAAGSRAASIHGVAELL
jgi:putative hydrolase of the HAD superfamily